MTRAGRFGAGDEPGFFNFRVGEIETWLAWFEGAIYTKNPPAPVRARMHEIAQTFGARVQGDDGESYDARGVALPSEEHVQPKVTRRSALLGYLVGDPLIFAINSPLGALVSLLAAIGAVVGASVIFDGLAAIAIAAIAIAVASIIAWTLWLRA